jgi:hypothetical protein
LGWLPKLPAIIWLSKASCVALVLATVSFAGGDTGCVFPVSPRVVAVCAKSGWLSNVFISGSDELVGAVSTAADATEPLAGVDATWFGDAVEVAAEADAAVGPVEDSLQLLLLKVYHCPEAAS